MAGHKPFSELTKGWSQARKDAVKTTALRESSLADLRKAIGLAQATVAQSLGVTQGEVSRMERRPDLYISTLRRYLEAMHGELRIVASFPGREDIVVSLGELERNDTDDETEPELATRR